MSNAILPVNVSFTNLFHSERKEISYFEKFLNLFLKWSYRNKISHVLGPRISILNTKVLFLIAKRSQYRSERISGFSKKFQNISSLLVKRK